ncbi:hypothetical protein CYMTET_33147, partial [Cymbomonas tetramitiformis]
MDPPKYSPEHLSAEVCKLSPEAINSSAVVLSLLDATIAQIDHLFEISRTQAQDAPREELPRHIPQVEPDQPQVMRLVKTVVESSPAYTPESRTWTPPSPSKSTPELYDDVSVSSTVRAHAGENHSNQTSVYVTPDSEKGQGRLESRGSGSSIPFETPQDLHKFEIERGLVALTQATRREDQLGAAERARVDFEARTWEARKLVNHAQ